METENLGFTATKEKEEKKEGTLYLVSTPIGNDDDISVRALKVMNRCDYVVCEEPKVGARTLHKYNIKQKMELLNEQNEEEKSPELLKWLMEGRNLALISDCGTPVFADPGFKLVQSCIRKKIDMVVVPGATSIMAAVVRSGFSISQFLYAGFLNRDKSERLRELHNLKNEPRTVILLETPYRLLPLLEACKKAMPRRNAYIGCNLTMRFETHHYGTFEDLYAKFTETRFKGEFVICFEGNYGKQEKGWTAKRDFARHTQYGDDDRYSSYGDKGGSYGDKGKSYGDKGGGYGDRGKRFGDKGGYGDKGKSYGDKGGYGDKGKSYGSDDRRKSYDRDDRRKSYDRDDRRKSYDNSDNKKSWDSSKEKRSYDSRDDKRSYDSRDDKKGGYLPRTRGKFGDRNK
jgi:16S rRNA (cytidine1402-2'-O)-methyltransferase